MYKIIKTTSKGQITLPIKWREKFKTDQFILNHEDDLLTIQPIKLETVIKKNDKSKWETIFDFKKDNNGKGIETGDFLKILKELDGQN